MVELSHPPERTDTEEWSGGGVRRGTYRDEKDLQSGNPHCEGDVMKFLERLIPRRQFVKLASWVAATLAIGKKPGATWVGDQAGGEG